MLRQPIIVVMGHVDHGKTSLLDTIRQTVIASKEAGGITQAIGTTEIPTDVIKNLCGSLLSRFKFSISVPGLLFIDTPGHEAFTTLRRRGGSIADLAILVVDINEGIMPQTEESINILKDTKTPFVIAVNKIDRIRGWNSGAKCFLDSFEKQDDSTKGDFEKNFYELIEQLKKFDFDAERFDRVQDFRKTVAAVPVSAKTGEGIPDLLATLIGLAQNFLKDQLVKTDESAGTILEVKTMTGLGTVIDCVIYDGTIHRNDFLAIGGKSHIITKIRALLVPDPMKDIRTEKKFRTVNECHAACGVRISAPGIENINSGVMIKSADTMEEAQKLLEDIEHEIEEVEIHTETEGLIMKAGNIGGLEALITIFKNYPIRRAEIGQITRNDVVEAESNTEEKNRVVIGFNTDVSEEAATFAKDKGVRILDSDIIYRLVEEYEKFVKKNMEDMIKKEVDTLKRPGKLKILPGLVFRASNPAIVGCEVTGGIVKPGYRLFKFDKDIKDAGEIKQIQSHGENVAEAKIGDKVAVSIIGPTVGRQINESDVLFTDLSSEDYKNLIKNTDFLSEHEKSVLQEIFEIKRKLDPRYGF
jgi:translation initiation factor 5B